MLTHRKFSLLTTTLLLSLTPLVFPNVVGAHGCAPLRLAQAFTTPNGAEVDRLFQEGVQQFRRGEYPKAVVTYQRVLEIRRQQNDKAGIGHTLNNLGEVYNWLRQPDKAIESAQAFLAFTRKTQNPVWAKHALNLLG